LAEKSGVIGMILQIITGQKFGQEGGA
jgi:hypothetical protein